MFALKGMWLFLRWNLHRDVSFSLFSSFFLSFFFFYDGSFLPLELKFFVGTPSCSPSKTFLPSLTLGTRRGKWTTKCSFSTTSLYIGRSNGRSSLYRNVFLSLWNSYEKQGFSWALNRSRASSNRYRACRRKLIFLVRLRRCLIPKRLSEETTTTRRSCPNQTLTLKGKRVTVK